MRKVEVRFKRIKVNKFSPKDKAVEVDIKFNDGMDKEITKKVSLDDPEALAVKIVQEIRSMEKASRQMFDGESIIDSTVNVVFADEDKTIQKMAGFFCKIYDKVSEVRNCRDPGTYLGLINRVNNLTFDF